MQAVVSDSLSNDVEMTRQAKRFKKAWSVSTDFISIPKRMPYARLKLQFPNLDEEVTPLIHPNIKLAPF